MDVGHVMRAIKRMRKDRCSTDTKKIMERNQACSLFIHVLNKDVISVVRSYLLRKPQITNEPHINYIEGCDRQMDTFMTVPQVDVVRNVLVLAKAMKSYPLDSFDALEFLSVWQYGCGTCDACKKAKR